MQKFIFQETSIENLKLITPFYAPDSRGYLTKTFEKSIFSAHGIDMAVSGNSHPRPHKPVAKRVEIWYAGRDRRSGLS